MIRRRFGVAILCPLLFVASHAQAQTSNGTTRVRLVNTMNGRTLVAGMLAARMGDSVAIVPDSSDGLPRRFAIATQYRLEQSAGVHRRTMDGFAIGAVAGALAGALIGTASYRKPTCPPDQLICLDFGRGFSTSAGAVVFAVPSAIIGAIAGYNSHREAWQAVPDDRTRLAFHPLPGGGMRVVAAISF
jgi:hypothetical protein